MNESEQNKKTVFFNVMPEATGNPGAMKNLTTPSAPVITSDTGMGGGAPAPEQIKMPKSGGGGKKFLLIPAAILILAIIAGAVWFLFFKEKKDDVVDQPIITEPEPTVVADVTTPGDWLSKYFKSETCTELNICGDKADPDRDGMSNKEEFDAGTDPNNADSDSEGISDGDEKFVFNSDPLVGRTYREGTYNDADFIKGGYDVQTNATYTTERLSQIKANIAQYGLHQPTITTLGDIAITLYEFNNAGEPDPLANFDQSAEAKLDRDSQRRSTIKDIGSALLKYKTAKKSYPAATDFSAMVNLIRPYNLVATNYSDPINASKYVYGYEVVQGNQDFTLAYFSETANQLIKYKAKDAEDDAAKAEKGIADEQRRADLERIKSALMVYSNSRIDPNSGPLYIFPSKADYQPSLVPKYMTELPKDPGSKLDYQYTVNETLDEFRLNVLLESPTAGKTGYECDQLDCREY